MSHTVLEYRTFDELVSEASSDLKTFSSEGMIDSSDLIKVAQLINKELGLKINPNKETVIEIDRGRGRLPDDFKTLNFALVAGNCKIERVYDSVPEYDYKKSSVEMKSDEDGNIEVIECFKLEKRIYREFAHVVMNGRPRVSRGHNHSHKIYGELKGSFFELKNMEDGNLYLNYQGSMEDCEGNLLVLDNPIANEYYEYAIKRRILENLFLNGEDVARRLDLVEARYIPARNNAHSLVNTPDFKELKRTHDANRKAMYHKFYKMLDY